MNRWWMGKVEKRRMDWGRHPDTKACPPTPSRLFPVPPGREVWYGCFCSQNQLYTMSVTASVVSPRLPPWASPCRPHMNIATATRSSSSSACEIKLFWNNFDIISVFCSHVTASETETKLSQPLKEFRHYFKIVSATSNALENVYELQ